MIRILVHRLLSMSNFQKLTVWVALLTGAVVALLLVVGLR